MVTFFVSFYSPLRLNNQIENTMKKHIINTGSILLLFLISTQIMAQQYRSAKEAQGLEVGAKAPLFAAMDQDSNHFKLERALEKGPVVLIFYRGHWCPVCNKHLGQVQDSLHAIYEKGASVVAISPEKVELLNKTASKTKAAFTLLHDAGYQIADAYDVTFKPDSKSRLMYNTMLGANLKSAHDDDSQRLPIPATYIIGTDGKILWRHFDPDYKKRSTVQDIVKHLP